MCHVFEDRRKGRGGRTTRNAVRRKLLPTFFWLMLPIHFVTGMFGNVVVVRTYFEFALLFYVGFGTASPQQWWQRLCSLFFFFVVVACEADEMADGTRMPRGRPNRMASFSAGFACPSVSSLVTRSSDHAP